MLVDLKASRVMPPPSLQIYFRPRAILTVDPVTTEVDRFMPFSRGTLVSIGVKIGLLSRRSRERPSASVLSICSSVAKIQKRDFLKN